MAKVTGPLFSLNASGKFADTLVFSQWKGINIARRYARPGGEPTSRQKYIKSLFAAATDMYRTLSGEDKEAWKQRAAGKPMSGYNMFIGRVMKALTGGTLDYNVISEVEIIPSGEDSVKVSFAASLDAPMLVRWGEEGSALTNTTAIDEANIDEGGRYSIILTDLDPESEYRLRLEQPELEVNVPGEITVETDGGGTDGKYEFMLAAVLSNGTKLIDMDKTGKLEPGPDVVDKDNPVEISWDDDPNIKEYLVYLIDRAEEKAELLGSTEINSFIWEGEKTPETLDISDEISSRFKSQAVLSSGESGDYRFNQMELQPF